MSARKLAQKERSKPKKNDNEAKEMAVNDIIDMLNKCHSANDKKLCEMAKICDTGKKDE